MVTAKPDRYHAYQARASFLSFVSACTVPKDVNALKCWSIPIMIFGILSLIGIIVGAWVQFIGGLFLLIGSCISICCTPKDIGPMIVVIVLYTLGGTIEFIGAIIGLVIILQLPSFFTTILLGPSVGLGAISGILAIVGVIMAFKAKKAIEKPAQPVKGTRV